VSPWRIRRVPQCEVCIVCEQACPTGAIRRQTIDFKECVRCDLCEVKLIKQAGTCRHDMAQVIASTHKPLPGSKTDAPRVRCKGAAQRDGTDA